MGITLNEYTCQNFCGPIVKWHNGAFALRRPGFDSRWVQNFGRQIVEANDLPYLEDYKL